MPSCDLLFTNATLIDGTGATRRTGALAVTDGRIVALGDCSGWQAARTVDATGHVLAPGFIDVHTHDDSALLSTPAMPAKTSQGVTSVIAGNCGISIAPLTPTHGLPQPLMLLGEVSDYRFPSVADYRRALEASPPSVNVGLLVGHSTLRAGAMTDTTRAATAEEIEAMAAMLDQALSDGGLGMSTGLSYPASRAAPTAEVVALARVTARHPGAIYTTHMRSERDQVVEAVGETLEIGREAALPVVISHHKCIGRKNFGKTTVTLSLIDKALATQDVSSTSTPTRQAPPCCCPSSSARRNGSSSRVRSRIPSRHAGTCRPSPPTGMYRWRKRPHGSGRPPRFISRWMRATCAACCLTRAR
jgi:N-acyl-D-amino-acid deacylase